ncbi:hypothetical protein [Salinarimonas soli]|uniref:Uncharacterized protein n=1 Tax=Salinarimonas soli TaxID=1638099 RepID=A0A5B2V8Y7_9HYPH|nr:hypothetical protein [Salinarimonas soli]KAA2234799.1 hypothetical protein F0L46_22895 [Salinarimonas soli]
MEHDDFTRLKPSEPATVLLGQDRHHFGRMQDAVQFALETAADEAWVITDRGLLAPEDLPRVAQKLSA